MRITAAVAIVQRTGELKRGRKIGVARALDSGGKSGATLLVLFVCVVSTGAMNL